MVVKGCVDLRHVLNRVRGIFCLYVSFDMTLVYIFIGLYTCSKGPSWSYSYGSWIYNYLCNQCLSPLMLWVRISIRVRCTTLCDKLCQWLVTGLWFSLGPLVSSTNKTDRHDITDILLKVALNTTKQTNNTCSMFI
jgi:hypothetical protein